MSHAAALYTVKVRQRRKPTLELLGAIGTEDAQLIWALRGYLDELRVSTGDGDRSVRAGQPKVDEATDELSFHLRVAHRGQRTDHYEGERRVFEQQPPHTAEVRSGALFKLPRRGNIGWLVLYVPYRRGAIGLLKPELQKRFREDFPGHLLEISPATEGTALEQAVGQNLIDKVELIRQDHHSDAFAGDSTKWVQRGATAEISLQIRAKSHMRLMTGLLRRYLEGDESAFGDIVEFEGMTFETAKVQADLGNGRRTFNIEKPESGHPLTLDIGADLTLDEDGWPTDDSLFSALRGALPPAAREA